MGSRIGDERRQRPSWSALDSEHGRRLHLNATDDVDNTVAVEVERKYADVLRQLDVTALGSETEPS